MAAKTIAQLMEEARIRAGAQNYKGHDYMDLARFDENTRHMIIFHVLTNDSPVGDKGDRMRLYLSDEGYQKALENAQRGKFNVNVSLPNLTFLEVHNMAFFNSAVEVLQTLVVALGAGLGVWGAINLMEGYGNDNPGANAHVR